MSLGSSVRLSVVILFSLQHSKHLRQDVTRVSHGRLFEVSRKFQVRFEEISRMFHESSKGAQVRLKEICSSFKEVLRVFERSSTGVSGTFQLFFKEVYKKFLLSFKSVSRMFQVYFKGDQGYFKF